MNNKKLTKIIYILMTLGLIAGIAFFLYKVLNSVIVGFGYPREILEPSNVALTRSILAGKPPYTLSALNYEIPAINYEYPFIGSLLAALIVKLTGCSVLFAHYFLSIASVIGTGILGFLFVKPYSKTLVAPLASTILFMMCHWRFGYISAAPDDLGFFFFVLTLYFAVSKKIKQKPLVCAIMTTICFYTKQYFIFVVLGIFIYMLFYSRKEAFKLALYTIVINVIAAIVITIAWPLYWTYSIFFLYNGTFTGIGFGITSLLEQMKYLSAIFIGMFAVLIVALVMAVMKKRKQTEEALSVSSDDSATANANGIKKIIGKVKENSAQDLFIIEIPVMFLPLVFFGRNDGAFLSYFLQLWMPSIIVVTFVVLEKMVAEYDKLILVLLYGGITAFTILFGYLKLPFHTMNAEELANWDRAYALINEYRDDGQIYYAPELAYLCFDNGDTNIWCGHDGEVSEVGLATLDSSPIWRRLFPYAEDIIHKNIDYRYSLSMRGFEYAYSLISFQQGHCMNFSEGYMENEYPYELLDRITLSTGNMPYEVSFYLPEISDEYWYYKNKE